MNGFGQTPQPGAYLSTSPDCTSAMKLTGGYGTWTSVTADNSAGLCTLQKNVNGQVVPLSPEEAAKIASTVAGMHEATIPPKTSAAAPGSKWLWPVVITVGVIGALAVVTGFASEKGRKLATKNRRKRAHSWREGPSEFAKRRSAKELRYAVSHGGGYGMTSKIARKELKRRGLK